jgi:hypothetical protein
VPEKEIRRGEAFDHGHLVAWSATALLIAQLIGIPGTASVAAALPLTIRHLRGRPAPSLALLTRWALAVLFIGTALAAMGGTRAAGAIATGPWAQAVTTATMHGSKNGAPLFLPMLIATLVFAGAMFLRGGIAGPILLAEAILFAGASAATVYSSAYNAFAATPVAFPIWTIAWIAGACILLAANAGDHETRRRRGRLIGGSLFAAALVLRLAAAPFVVQFLRAATLP